jgi:D-cysteine desulfhydrase family pyridoxal phosphate-dependent enzyme
VTPIETLASQPRAVLGHWPTPLQPADRLRGVIGGPRIWLKRDDCTGLAVGGNKTRKLEYLLGKALAEGADTVITYGALQSNHARQTAAACAKLGLRCELILTRLVDRADAFYEQSGNRLLDGILGARVHECADADEAIARTVALHDEAPAEGRTTFTVVGGGSDATGALGYVHAALELAAQAGEQGVDVGRIVVAASTAGTAAGLAVGSVVAGLDATIDVACVLAPVAETAPLVYRLGAEVAELLGAADAKVPLAIADTTLGAGYGIPNPATLDAVELLARTEGVLLDPVYTGKAFEHLLAEVAAGQLDPDRDVVFVHTGGSPGLFAYTPEFTARLTPGRRPAAGGQQPGAGPERTVSPARRRGC